MSRGEKTTEFDHGFQYSDGGVFAEGAAITVRAPSLSKFEVHARMQSICNKALLAFYPMVQKLAGASSVDENDEDAPANSGAKKVVDALQIISSGMDEEDYAKFLSWLRRTLTNAPQLACVAGSKIPLTDEVWDSLADRGGMDAVLSVLSDFSSFFFTAAEETKPSASVNGGGSSSTSSPEPKAVLVTRQPSNSRSRS